MPDRDGRLCRNAPNAICVRREERENKQDYWRLPKKNACALGQAPAAVSIVITVAIVIIKKLNLIPDRLSDYNHTTMCCYLNATTTQIIM